MSIILPNLNHSFISPVPVPFPLSGFRIQASPSALFFCFRYRVLEMFCKQDLDCSTHHLFMKAS